MIKKRDSLLSALSPIDAATVFYAVASGVYICFGAPDFSVAMPHLAVRLALLAFIGALAAASLRFGDNKTFNFARSLYPLLFLTFFYSETADMNNFVFKSDFDASFIWLEQALWHCQPSMLFSQRMGQAWFSELMNLSYFSYYLIITVSCMVLYISRPEVSQKSIFTVIFSFYLYYIIFAVFPVAGPQYAIPEIGQTHAPLHFFGRIMEHITTSYERPTGAFPSSHVGISLIVTWLLFKHHRRLFLLTAPFALGICFATVYVKAHYLVDVLGGILSAPLFIIVSSRVFRMLRHREARHRLASGRFQMANKDLS